VVGWFSQPTTPPATLNCVTPIIKFKTEFKFDPGRIGEVFAKISIANLLYQINTSS
jgi:hypothetical protein